MSEDSEYSARLCDDRHMEITRKFDTLFKKFDILSFVVVLFTIAVMVFSIIKGMQ